MRAETGVVTSVVPGPGLGAEEEWPDPSHLATWAPGVLTLSPFGPAGPGMPIGPGVPWEGKRAEVRHQVLGALGILPDTWR